MDDARAAHGDPHPIAVVCEVRGAAFVAPVGRALDALCIKCGAEDAPHASVLKVTKAPFWLWLTAAGICPWLILYFIVRRVSRHDIRSCGPCRARWRLSYLWQILATLLLLVLALVPALAAPPLPDAVAGLLFLGLLLAAFVAPPIVFGRARVVARSIDDGYVELVGVSPELVRKLGVPSAE